VVLCLFGGVAGIAIGRGNSTMRSALLGWPIVTSVVAVLIAVATSFVVGLISGYYPAWKASRLDPIEALRRD
jgi:ABC-type antimicrobial peptide transport system permease subunit